MRVVLCDDNAKEREYFSNLTKTIAEQNNIFIDMHVQVDPDMNVRQSHMLMHEIEKTIQKDINSNTHVIIHIEPYSGKDDNSI